MTNSERLWKRAIYLLAQRDHSRGELQQKFQRARKKATPEEITATLDKLESKKLLKSSPEIAALWIESYKRQGRGSRWILQKLKTKGIDLSHDQARDLNLGETEEELETARRFCLKKFKTLGPFHDAKLKARVARALSSRGFTMDVVIDIVKGR